MCSFIYLWFYNRTRTIKLLPNGFNLEKQRIWGWDLSVHLIHLFLLAGPPQTIQQPWESIFLLKPSKEGSIVRMVSLWCQVSLEAPIFDFWYVFLLHPRKTSLSLCLSFPSFSFLSLSPAWGLFSRLSSFERKVLLCDSTVFFVYYSFGGTHCPGRSCQS